MNCKKCTCAPDCAAAGECLIQGYGQGLPLVAGSPFVVAPHTLQFRCETAVYRDGSGTSVCYVTSEDVGKLVAAALNHFEATGAMAKYLSENSAVHPPQVGCDESSDHDSHDEQSYTIRP